MRVHDVRERIVPGRIATVVVVLLLAAVWTGAGTTLFAGDAGATPAGSSGAAGGSIVTRTLTNAAGTRDFQQYRPVGAGPGRPLIVWLHGASRVPRGDPRQLRRTSVLLTEADRQGYAVVAPMQSLRADPAGTWRLTDPSNFVRGKGEASIVADIVRRAVRELQADPARVYLVGHSAGGAMTQNVAALYPEVFAGIATSAGIPFAADPTGAAAAIARTDRGPLPTLIVQGDRDSVTPPILGEIGVSAALGANGIRGVRGSSATIPATVSGDPYSSVVTRYGRGQQEVVSAVVHGADHWTGPGGVTVNGPALDRLLIDFLVSKHR